MTGPRLRFVDPTGLYEGVPYHYAAAVGPHELLFTAGACPLDDEGQTVAPGNVSAQAAQAVTNLFATLAAAGSSPSSCCTPRCTSRPHAGATSSAHGTCSRPLRGEGTAEHPPRRGVPRYPEQLVEIQAVALIAPPD